MRDLDFAVELPDDSSLQNGLSQITLTGIYPYMKKQNPIRQRGQSNASGETTIG
jgi:hypothetical protein